MSNRSIGIFDSGLGGLSVVNALTKLLPNEDIVYFGDTGRVPYGTRSRDTIEQYTSQDITFLQSKKVKLIIAACGTVSSVAPHIGEACGTPFIGVVTPTATEAATATKNNKVGIIGTAATIASNSYALEMQKQNPATGGHSLSWPGSGYNYQQDERLPGLCQGVGRRQHKHLG